jgi:hypothetical protein
MMRIIPSELSPTNEDLLQMAIMAWEEHPLRRSAVDQRLIGITVIIEEVEDDYGLNADNHPEYRLKCAPKSLYVSIPPRQVITHEFTHLIDRFDPMFSGERNPEDVKELIDAMPKGNANESVKRAFNDYWNAYIDGRLHRQGIAVHSLADRIKDKLGQRQGEEIMPGEKESIEEMWNRESCTLDELIQLATRYPNRRAKRYWINDSANSA